MLHIPRLTIDDEIRFWSKAIRKGPNDCWNWIGACFGNTESRRRPSFRVKDWNFIAARVAWVIAHKQDPGDLLVCHSCIPELGKRQLCVNPNHLWLGTYSQNSQHAADNGQLSTTNRSKLLDHDKQVIKKRYDDGEKPSKIGLDYNLHRKTIWEIATKS